MFTLCIWSRRIGHHSTSDDSSAYRSIDEVNKRDKEDHPITRLRMYLVGRDWWSDEDETAWMKESRTKILAAFERAEKKKKPSPTNLFTDVYDDVPPHLQRQMEHMKKHVNLYKEHYPLDSYQPM